MAAQAYLTIHLAYLGVDREPSPQARTAISDWVRGEVAQSSSLCGAFTLDGADHLVSYQMIGSDDVSVHVVGRAAVETLFAKPIPLQGPPQGHG
jgi:hypothetical protein